MIQAVSLQVCQTIKDENSEVGFDPRDVFMNGSMNVEGYLNIYLHFRSQNLVLKFIIDKLK